MRKIKLYIAASLNGKIARTDGSVDWLEEIPNPEKSDYGYAAFFDSIDTTIMGFKTYKQIIDWNIPFPYTGKKNYVITRQKELSPSTDVEFISFDHEKKIHQLKQQDGKDIWLIGGSQINTMLINAKLIDEMILFIMPVILPDGIDLFASKPTQTEMRLIDSKQYSSDVMELTYRFLKEN